jgi:hypothetical protein
VHGGAKCGGDVHWAATSEYLESGSFESEIRVPATLLWRN